jgi:imidazoleglycerol-phosphate dehydratase
MPHRIARIKRKTKETAIELTLDLDGTGKYKVETPVPFLTHMIESFAKHSGFDLILKADGDTHVDDHHTVEDIGICLGEALNEALGDKAGISRFGHAYVPMDESLVRAVVDLSGRSHLNLVLTLPPKKKLGSFDSELLEEFFTAFTDNAKINLHLEMIHGRNSHHIIEAAFKSLARALRAAAALDGRSGIPSIKGAL